ncbi:hypothetical protein BRD00_00085 [Halobacteriales archaeon QS_8_69_26]|nr:MAG: hypothetical protein BRD00_00085 [Halobacteriales archaeon QS_8_69_26]
MKHTVKEQRPTMTVNVDLGDVSGIQLLLIIGAGLIALGKPIGKPVFVLALTVWLIFVLLTLSRQV